MKKILLWIKEMMHFITEGIWRTSKEDLPKTHSFLIRQLKISVIAARGFSKDMIQLRASALTLYSLLSVVPVVAMLFVIANGFGFKERIQKELIKSLQGQEEVIKWIVDFADRLLDNVNGGLLTGAGIVILLWSIMQILGNIESAFNGIWQIKKPRPFFRKFSDYLSMMLIAPVLILLSGSSTIFVSSQLDKFSEMYPILENLKFLLKFSPYFLIWIVFTLLYVVMPNTKVNFKSALIAGVIAGTIFQLVQWGYIHFQVGVSRYSAIYGSFAALPLFLIWLQISWVVVLLGAEISFANQNVNQYEFELDSLSISKKLKKLMTLMIATNVVKDFAEGRQASTASQISNKLNIPVRLVREVIYELTEARIFSELNSENPRERAFQPSLDINLISVVMIMDRLEETGSEHIAPIESKEYQKLKKILGDFSDIMSESNKNVLLKDI